MLREVGETTQLATGERNCWELRPARQHRYLSSPVLEMRRRCPVIFSTESWLMQQEQNAEVLLDGFAEQQRSPRPMSASDVLQTSCQEELIRHLKSGIKMGQSCKMHQEQEKPVLLSASVDVLLLLVNGFPGSDKREDPGMQRELAVLSLQEKASNTEEGSATKIHGLEEYVHGRNRWGKRLQGNRDAETQMSVGRVSAGAGTKL